MQALMYPTCVDVLKIEKGCCVKRPPTFMLQCDGLSIFSMPYINEINCISNSNKILDIFLQYCLLLYCYKNVSVIFELFYNSYVYSICLSYKVCIYRFDPYNLIVNTCQAQQLKSTRAALME